MNNNNHPQQSEPIHSDSQEDYSAIELYNRSVELLNQNNEKYYNEAYQCCVASYRKSRTDYTAFNLALMHLRGVAPVWDGIFASELLAEAHQKGHNNAKKELDHLNDSINDYSPHAKTNPLLPSSDVPIINGIEKSLREFESIAVNTEQGFLCGRIGSILDYPLIEVRKSQYFQSIGGYKLGNNPSDGICLNITFTCVGKEPTCASIEEAYYYNIFKQLDIFKEFTCFLNTNIRNSEYSVANVWEFAVDCGHDINKATRIANSLIYHLYGYKANSFLYPEIFLKVQPEHFFISSPTTDGLGFYYILEQFNWIDAVLLSIGIIAPFIWVDGIILPLILAFTISICYLTNGGAIVSQLKKLRFPKRNYIYNFKYPNIED